MSHSLEDSLHGLLAAYMRAPAWLRGFAGGAYRRLPITWRYGKDYPRFLQQAAAGFEVDAAAVDERLSNALRTAITHVPAYKGYRALLEDPRPAHLRLRHLPTVDKLEIKRDASRFLAGHLQPGRRLPTFTGGSTAHPMAFFLERGKTRPRETAYIDHINRVHLGARDGEWTLNLRGRTVPGAQRDHGKVSSLEPIKRHVLASSDHLEERHRARYEEALRRLRPTMIHAFPSALYPLARWLQERPIPEFTHNVHGILLTSENVYAFQRELFQRVFACPLVRQYGHSERVLMAIAVDQPGSSAEAPYRFYPLYGYPEILDADGHCIEAPGVIGELVGTSFDNDVMPFVRYRTGDLAAWSEPPCMTGVARFSVLRIEGRLQEFVVCKDRRLVSITTLGAAHFSELACAEQIQFLQEEIGRVTLKVVSPAPLSAKQVRAIARAVRDKTQGGIEVHVAQVASIERSSRGKHRMLEQHLDLTRYHGASFTSLERDHLLNGPSAVHASVTCAS